MSMQAGADEVAVKLDVRNRREFSAEMQHAARDVRGVGNAAREVDGHVRRTTQSAGIMGRAFREVGAFGARTLTYGLTGVATVATGLGAAFVKMGIGAVAGFEQAEIAFDTMLPAGMDARAFLEDLEQFANRTPFEFPGLVHGTQVLMAFGFEAEDLLPLMERIGDAASGLGAGQEGIDRMTRALGQMRTAGRLNSRDMMQLTEVGVPAWQYLADAAGTSIGEIRSQVERGEIDAMYAVRNIVAGMERDFGGLMDRQSRTIQGRWSTLMDTIRTAGRRAFDPFTQQIGDALLGATHRMEEFGVWFAAEAPGFINHVLETGGRAVDAFLSGNAGQFGDAMSDMFGGDQWVQDTFTTLYEMGVDFATVLTELVIPVLEDLGDSLPISPLQLVANILDFLADNAEELRPVLTGLLTAFLAYKVLTSITGAFTALNAAMHANPAILIASAVIGLAYALKYAYDNSETFRNAVDATWQALQTAWHWVTRVVSAIWGFLDPIDRTREGMRFLKDTFVDVVNTGIAMAETLGNTLLAPFILVAEAWNALDFSIDISVPGWVPGIGGNGWQVDDLFPDIPVPRMDLPQLHDGGRTTSAGWANIQPDEEAVFLPPAAQVVPLDDFDVPNLGALMAQRDDRDVVLVIDNTEVARASLNGMRELAVGR